MYLLNYILDPFSLDIGCNATQFACTTFDRSGPACIPKEWVCDGQVFFLYFD